MTREASKTSPAASAGALRGDQNTLIATKGFSFSGYERDPLYANLGGKKVLDISGISGVDSVSDGRAGVFADFDDDGDLDVFMTTIQGQAHMLFRNEVGQASGWLRIALEGTRSGRDAFGATVRVGTSAGTLTKVKSAGSGFISQHDPRLLFGLGSDAAALWIEVAWPSGAVERFAGAPARSSLRIREGEGAATPVVESPGALPSPVTAADRVARGLNIQVGRPFPSIPGVDLAGRKSSLAKLVRPGRRTLVNFWATWCVACRREIPELVSLAPELAAAGVDLAGVSIDTGPREAVARYAKEKGVRYPILVAAEKGIRAVWKGNEVSVPLTVVVGADGRVESILGGAGAATMRAVRALAKPGGEAATP